MQNAECRMQNYLHLIRRLRRHLPLRSKGKAAQAAMEAVEFRDNLRLLLEGAVEHSETEGVYFVLL